VVPLDESEQAARSSPNRPVIISELSIRWFDLQVEELYPPPDVGDLVPLLGTQVAETAPATDFIHEDVEPLPGLDYEPWGIEFKNGRWEVPDGLLE
jgi:hypothetical protein